MIDLSDTFELSEGRSMPDTYFHTSFQKMWLRVPVEDSEI